jgi:hypothetical protein
MNERIADILDQAFDLCRKYDDEGKTGLVKTTEAFYVFAELIVKECVGVVEGGRFLHDEAPTAQFARECAGAIRRHFGVQS